MKKKKRVLEQGTACYCGDLMATLDRINGEIARMKSFWF